MLCHGSALLECALFPVFFVVVVVCFVFLFLCYFVSLFSFEFLFDKPVLCCWCALSEFAS